MDTPFAYQHPFLGIRPKTVDDALAEVLSYLDILPAPCIPELTERLSEVRPWS
jgi:hypothetical protein